MEFTASSSVVVGPQSLVRARVRAAVPALSRAGTARYPLVAVIIMSVGALLAIHLSVLAIA